MEKEETQTNLISSKEAQELLQLNGITMMFAEKKNLLKFLNGGGKKYYEKKQIDEILKQLKK